MLASFVIGFSDFVSHFFMYFLISKGMVKSSNLWVSQQAMNSVIAYWKKQESQSSPLVKISEGSLKN